MIWQIVSEMYVLVFFTLHLRDLRLIYTFKGPQEMELENEQHALALHCSVRNSEYLNAYDCGEGLPQCHRRIPPHVPTPGEDFPWSSGTCLKHFSLIHIFTI